MVNDLLSDLNPPQREAAEHIAGPAILLAGPGSGKTKTLTKRAAHLVQSGIAPERILLITFSRASAKEMLFRAKALDSRCAFISGGTFHAVATKIINQNSHVFGATKPFVILDPEDVSEIIKKLIIPMKEGDKRNWPRASTFAKIISYSVNTKLSTTAVIEKRWPDLIDFKDDIDLLRRRFISFKLDRGLLDYDDCLTYFAALLENQITGPLIRSKWSHIMVDEYQDTNALQLQIVYALAGERQNLMIVGDPAQSIYGFRGSAPATMAEFQKQFPASRVINLETNYRSSQEIVSVVNAIDRAMKIGFARVLHSARGASGAKPTIIETNDAVSEAAAIADSIIEHKALGGEIADNAVLVRSMSVARRLEAEFISRRIPYVVRGGLKIDESAHVKDLLSIARVFLNTEHEPAWLRLLQRYPKIGPKAADQIIERLVQATSIDEASQILKEEQTKRKTVFLGLGHALIAMRDVSKPAEALSQVTAIMEPFWKDVWSDDWKDRLKDIDALLLIAEEHQTMDAFLTAVTLDHSLDKKNEGVTEKLEEMPVTISTVHGAKGLEWKIVHIPSFLRGHMPSIFANGPDEQDEEKRIFYVAVSRAMEQLRLYRPAYDAKSNFTSPSDFERLIAAHVEYEKYVTPDQSMAGGTIDTNARIDMRAMLLSNPA